MLAASFGHAGHGWLQHLYWWWEVHTGTVNEGGPYYGALSGYVGDIGLLGTFGTLIALLVHQVKRAQCHIDDPNCRRIGTHEYEADGVKHRVCKRHHPALGPSHRLTHAHLLAHHAAKQPKSPVVTTTSSGNTATGGVIYQSVVRVSRNDLGSVRQVDVSRPSKPVRDAHGRFVKRPE